MGDHDQAGAARTVEREHQLEHRLGVGAVEIASRLVSQQARRLGDQCPSQGRALAFTAGEFTRPVCKTMPEADRLQTRGGTRERLATRAAADQQRHRDVLQCAELGQQMVELVQEAERPVAQTGERALPHRVHPLSAQADLAGRRGIEPAEQVQQRALARTGTADDSDTLAGTHLEVDAAQHGHLAQRRALAIDLRQPAAFEHHRPRVTHSAAPVPG